MNSKPRLRYLFNRLGILGFVSVAFGACPQIGSAQTVSIFDVLVATETLTVVGTTTIRGNSFSVGGSALVVSSISATIGTATLPSNLSVAASTAASPPTVYAVAGESTFVVPAGANQIFVKAWGGGGGAGAIQSTVSGGTASP